MSDVPAPDQARVQHLYPREIPAALLQDSDDGVWVVDATGSLLVMNPAAERLLGWTEDALRGTAIHDAIHGPCAVAAGTLRPHAGCPLLDMLQTGRRVTVAEDVFTRQDGAALQVAYTATPILRAGQVREAITDFHQLGERQLSKAPLGWLAVIARDTTERKRVELELHTR
jgi:PAS domain S-box-containing protein